MPTDAIEPAPTLTLETAAQLAQQLWGVEGGAKALPSYIDANVHITPRDSPGYVLKVANAYEPRAELELQNAAMRWIHGRLPGVCPVPLETADGRDIVALELDGRAHLARMVSFLPGQLYASARPHDDALLASLGRFMGRLDRALEASNTPPPIATSAGTSRARAGSRSTWARSSSRGGARSSRAGWRASTSASSRACARSRSLSFTTTRTITT